MLLTNSNKIFKFISELFWKKKYEHYFVNKRLREEKSFFNCFVMMHIFFFSWLIFLSDRPACVLSHFQGLVDLWVWTQACRELVYKFLFPNWQLPILTSLMIIKTSFFWHRYDLTTSDEKTVVSRHSSFFISYFAFFYLCCRILSKLKNPTKFVT